MSIDLGSEYMKIGLVKPGVPMEIVLNKESRRKTPTIIALRNGERFFGDVAAQMVKFTELIKYIIFRVSSFRQILSRLW
jgi:molecular chaperone DnaK (HSP70)